MKPGNISGKKHSVFFRIVFPIILILICFAIEIIDSEVFEKFFGYVLIGILLTVFYAYWWYDEWKKSCPKCKCWAAKEVVEKKLIDYRDTQSKISYETKVIDSNRTTTKFYEESSSYLKYLYRFKCKFCDYSWEDQQTERIDHKSQI